MWSDGLHTTATYVSLKRATLFDTSAKHLLGLRYQQMAVRRTEDWRCLQLPSSCKRSWRSCLPLPCMVILLFLTRRKDSCIVFDAVIVMMELVPPLRLLSVFFFLEGCEEIQEESKVAGANKPLPGRKSLLAQSHKDQLVKLVFAGRGTEVITMMTDLRLATSCQPSS